MVRTSFFAFPASSVAGSFGRFFGFCSGTKLREGASGGGSFSGLGLVAVALVLAVFCGSAVARVIDVGLFTTSQTTQKNCGQVLDGNDLSTSDIPGCLVQYTTGGSSRSDIIITLDNNFKDTNSLTGFSNLVRINVNGNNVQLKIDGLNLTPGGDFTTPINITGTDKLTLILLGSNILTGSNGGGAGIRVSQNASLVIKEGEGGGSLTVTGGGNGGLNNFSAGGGAGIGGMGAACPGINDTKCTIYIPPGTGVSANTRVGETCGNVTIESGTITANGGGGLAGASGRRGGGAGIGGGGAQGNSDAAATAQGGGGCNLIINGGIVKATAPLTTHKIGGGTTNTLQAGSASVGTVKINGGSVNVLKGEIGDGKVSIGSSRTNLTPNNLERYEILIGYANKSSNASVKACANIGGFTCDSTINSATAAANINGRYGIKGVKTDANGKVYFWLPSEPNSNNGSIRTDSTYTYHPGTSYIYKGPAPTMTVPVANPNSLVDLATFTYGPYKTDFQMRNRDHVAAVGHEIVLYGGKYNQNDANTSGQHWVQWYRSDINETGKYAECSSRQDNPCVKLTKDNSTIAIENDGHQDFSDGEVTVTYTPDHRDIGKYVWAEVIARDVNGVAGEPNRYPNIKVGVVIKTNVWSKDNDISIPNASNSISITQNYSPISNDNLILDFSPLSKLSLVTSGVLNKAGREMNVKHKWSAQAYMNRDGGLDPLPEGIDALNFFYKDDKTLADIKTDSPNSYKDNFFDGTVFKFAIAGVVTDKDILIEDEVKNAETPRLDLITIDGFNKSDDCDGLYEEVGHTCTWFVDPRTNTTTINKPVSKEGSITLKFFDKLVNVENDITMEDGTEYGKGKVIFGSEAPLFNNSNKDSINTLTYSYDLGDDPYYILTVSDFVNKVGNIMPNVQVRINVVSAATVTWKKDYSGQFIVTDSIQPTTMKYAPGNSGPLTKLCYYWQDGGTEDGAPDVAGTYDVADADAAGHTCLGTSGVIISDTVIDITKLKRKWVSADFGRWYRLVVRPIGTYPVNGNDSGVAVFGQWKRVGVKLIAGALDYKYPVAPDVITPPATAEDYKCPATVNAAFSSTNNKCSAYSNINIAGCDMDNSGNISSCSGGTLTIYKLGVLYRLSTDVNTIRVSNKVATSGMLDFKLNGWKCNNGTPVCSSSEVNMTQLGNGYFQLLSAPDKGEYTLIPNVEERTPVQVTTATVQRANLSDLELVASGGEGSDIHIKSTLSIVFNNSGVALGSGSIRVVRKSGTQPEKSYTCNETGNGSACTVNLDFEDEGFKFSNETSGWVFGKDYKIIISGFKKGDEPVEVIQFNVTTAPGPSITIVDNEIESDELAYRGKNYFAVGHQIKATLGVADLNGGLTSTSLECKWMIGGSPILATTNCNDEGVLTYTPGTNPGDYGKEIYLVVTPKDAYGRVGTIYESPRKQIGVELKFGLVTGTGVGDVQTVAFGTTTVNGEHAVSDKVIVIGTTPLRWYSNVASDKPEQWLANSTPIGDNVSTINYTPSAPTNDITISLSVKDGAEFIISADKSGDYLVFTFDEGAKAAVPYNTGKEITITKSNSTEVWSYTIDDGSSAYFSNANKVFTVPLTAFLKDGEPFDPTTIGNNSFIVGIEGGAFKDANENYTRKIDRLMTLRGDGVYYAVSLSKRSIYISETYGNLDTTSTYGDDIVVTNKSSGPITIAADFQDDTYFEATNLSGADIAVSGTEIIKLKLKDAALDLNVNEYKDSLIITMVDGGDEIKEGVEIIFNVKPKTIAPTGSGTFALATTHRPYGGRDSLDAPPYGGDWAWNRYGVVLDQSATDINILPRSGKFGDGIVGNNKPVNAYYEIVGTKKDNYSFTNYEGDSTKTFPGLFADIKPKPIEVVIGGNKLAKKEYDGINYLGISDIVSGTTFALGQGIIEADTLSPDNENGVYLDHSGISIRVSDPTANTNNKQIDTISGIYLAGKNAGNYVLNPIAKTALDAKIDPATLGTEELKANYGAIIHATATYGDHLINSSSWKDPPSTSEEVKKGDNYVSGKWSICVNATENPNCAGKIPSSTIVDYPAPTNVYAYFNTTNPNYEKDLIVPIDLSGFEKKRINFIAELENLGRGYGIKYYDGSEYIGLISGKENSPVVVALDSNDLVHKKDLYDTVSGNYLVKFQDGSNPKFIGPVGHEKDQGKGKFLAIDWELTGDAAMKYASMSGTSTGRIVTTGTIEKRQVNINGLEAHAKYYDGKTDAVVTSGSVLTVQTRAEGIAECATKRSACLANSNNTEAACEKEFVACNDIAKDMGDIEGGLTVSLTPGSEFHFSNASAGRMRAVSPNNPQAFVLTGAEKDNYQVPSVGLLNADIYQRTFSYYMCHKFNAPANECSDTDSSITEAWIRDTTNMKKAVKTLIGLGPTNNEDSYAMAIYGDQYGTIAGALASSDGSGILPTDLTSVMGADELDGTTGSWSWVPNGYVPEVKSSPWYINALYMHSSNNYAYAEIPVPLKIAKKPLELVDVSAEPQDYERCRDGFPEPCPYDDYDREVKVLNYSISGVVNNEINNYHLKVVGMLDSANAGENRKVSIASIDWAFPEIDRNKENNYELPSAVGVNIPPVTIGKAEYPPQFVPSALTVLVHRGERNSLIYDRDKYPKLASIGFDRDSSYGWSWKYTDQLVEDPQNSGYEYISKLYQAEYWPPSSNGIGGISPGDIFEKSGNYRPAERPIELKIYRRSEDWAARSTLASKCGADTARITVAARNEYATVWFDGNQYYDNEKAQNIGSFTKTGLEYGANRIDYRVNAQAYNIGKDTTIYHTRMLPFTSVAKWVRGKSLTVSLDSSLLADKEFFRKHKFDLTKTRWLNGKDSVGTGMILPVASGTGDYSLVLFSPDGAEVKEGFASCKESGDPPELPGDLEWVPVSNIAKKLIATPFGSRVVVGGSNVVFNTPNGGTVSIYTVKGELISRMVAVDNRTVVRVPATNGIYIVKLEAK